MILRNACSNSGLITLSLNQSLIWFNDKVIKPELEQALRKIIPQKNEIAGHDSQIQTRQTQITNITQDQQRLRENMKALKGSVEEKALVQRYTRELNSQEDKLQAVRTEIANLAAKRAASQALFFKMLQAPKLYEVT